MALPPNPTGADLIAAVDAATNAGSQALIAMREGKQFFPSDDEYSQAAGQIAGGLAGLQRVRDQIGPDQWDLPQPGRAAEYERAAGQVKQGIDRAQRSLGDRGGLGGIYIPGVDMGVLADQVRWAKEKAAQALRVALDWRVWLVVGGLVLLLLVLGIIGMVRKT